MGDQTQPLWLVWAFPPPRWPLRSILYWFLFSAFRSLCLPFFPFNFTHGFAKYIWMKRKIHFDSFEHQQTTRRQRWRTRGTSDVNILSRFLFCKSRSITVQDCEKRQNCTEQSATLKQHLFRKGSKPWDPHETEAILDWTSTLMQTNTYIVQQLQCSQTCAP